MDAFRYKNPVLGVSEFLRWAEKEPLCVFDCRFYLVDPGQGQREYVASHIPGAKYLHLDDDLSGPRGDGSRGRHPLPDAGLLWTKLQDLGVTRDSIVVGYDSSGGPYASRLWWLLRQMGFQNVWVLDGGWGAWLAYLKSDSDLAQSAIELLESNNLTPSELESGPADNSTQPGFPAPMVTNNGGIRESIQDLVPELVEVELIEAQKDKFALIDSRTHDRYLGQNETIDPVAGHIPGAANLSWQDNLNPLGHFLSPEVLQKRFEPFFGARLKPVFYCGSGVTACHNVLATQIAGLPMPALYADSWSGWISDPRRPIELGDEKVDL
ncbi:MAG: sulfurtransferase [Bacteroidetes bacterium]|nr:sulfurtransferase [Bacteroidota bacterium]